MNRNNTWDELTFEQQWAAVAEHYADVTERSLATLRQALESDPTSTGSRIATLLWFAQNLHDQGEMMKRRLSELGGFPPQQEGDAETP